MLSKVSGTLVSLAVVLVVAQAAQAAPAAAPAPPARERADKPAERKDGKKAAEAKAKKIEHGRYLVKIAGCNDCHTPGYTAAAGKVPESAWLTGDTLGWRGDWGTTYPANLRLHASKLSEKEWIAAVRKMQTRPPMPWFGLREMRKPDLAAIFQFIKQLGPVGAAAPAFMPPGTEPKPPFVQFPLPAKK